jgi:alkylation response protein AidB-like acyl-CoA dehydrogenase
MRKVVTMSFQDTPEQAELRKLARQFAQKELMPIIEKDEHEERFRPEIIRALGELGLAGIPFPEEFGGAGLGYQDYIVALEELAKASSAYAISVAVTGLAQMIIHSAGTDEQKKRFLPRLTSGEAIGAFSLSEAGSGSDAGSLRTTAKIEGDHYVVNGTKLWTTQGDVAEVVMLMARTGGPGTSGVTCLLVEKSTPGFKLGKREKKMGAHTSHTMELVFENARIPVKNRIGAEGQGFKAAMNALNGGRITIAAIAVGLAEAALEVATEHARTREQFGKKIGEFQGISFMLADMKTQLDASRLLVRRAAALRDAGEPFALEASMAKLFATDAAMKITTDAVQILGGSGYTQEFPVERYMREAKVLQIVEGTNQVQRMIIGRELLRD